MKKLISLFFITMISVLLVACEPPSVTDIASSIPTITLSNATLNLEVGETKLLGITVRGFAASELRYVSQDTSIATVNAAGLVTAVSPGAVLVTASYQDLSESVYVFVLPDLESLSASTATVVDVQLSPTNEVILVYSDGRLENTGIQAAITTPQVTIRSAVVNAAGNLIVTLSDGSTLNAGRVVGATGPSGPSGSSGGGGTGATGAAGISITGVTLQGTNLVFSRSGGASNLTVAVGSLLSGGSSSELTIDDVLDALDIDEAQWDTILTLLNINDDINFDPSGLRQLLGFTQAELDAITNSQGLLSYNRYKLFYPGYQGTEEEWLRELIFGTLIIDIDVTVSTTVNEVFFPAGSVVSGIYGLDYEFFHGGGVNYIQGLTNSGIDALFLSGTIYLQKYPTIIASGTNTQGPIVENIVRYGQGVFFDAFVESGLAILNTGRATTLKGALIRPDNNFRSGVSVFPNNPFNFFHERIKFQQWNPNTSSISDGTIDSTGRFIINSGASVFATYEPINSFTMSEITAVSYYEHYLNDLIKLRADLFAASGLIDLSVPEADALKWIFRTSNSGVNYLVDFNGVALQRYWDDLEFYSELDSITASQDFFRHFYTPTIGAFLDIVRRYEDGLIGVDGFGFTGTYEDTIIINNAEGHHFSDLDVPGRFEPDNYIIDEDSELYIRYSQDVDGFDIKGELIGNNVREWDLFYVVLSSSGVFKDSGILNSSGFNLSKISSSSTNSGYVQLTYPFNYTAVFTSGFANFGSTNRTISLISNQPTSFAFEGDVYQNTVLSASNRNSSAGTITIATLAQLTQLAEGDVVFIRREVNYASGTILATNEDRVSRYALVQDTTNPVLSGVFLLSSSTISPLVAKVGDEITIVMVTDEPVNTTYTRTYNPSSTTGILFKSSGTSLVELNSGFTVGRSSQNPADPAGMRIDYKFDTFFSKQIRVPISSIDASEGYFYFSGLGFADRAGNPASISYSDFPNRVWIDPVAPAVTLSGLTSVVEDEDEQLYLEPTTESGIVVSGVVHFDFAIVETVNDITSGLVYYSGLLKGSGLEVPFNQGLHEFLENFPAFGSGLASGADNLFELEFDFDSRDLDNGLYILELRVVDFVGNVTNYSFEFTVENELLFESISYTSGVNGAITTFTLNFSINVVTSGFTTNLPNNVVLLELINSGLTSDKQSSQTGFVLNNIAGKSMTFNVSVNNPWLLVDVEDLILKVTILKPENFADRSELVILTSSGSGLEKELLFSLPGS